MGKAYGDQRKTIDWPPLVYLYSLTIVRWPPEMKDDCGGWLPFRCIVALLRQSGKKLPRRSPCRKQDGDDIE